MTKSNSQKILKAKFIKMMNPTDSLDTIELQSKQAGHGSASLISTEQPDESPVARLGFSMEERIDILTKLPRLAGQQRTGHWARVGAVIVGSIFFFSVLSYCIIDYMMPDSSQLSNQRHYKKWQAEKESFEATVKDTVPYVSRAYATLEEPLLLRTSQHVEDHTASTRMESLFEQLHHAVPHVTLNETRTILESMGLLKIPSIAKMAEAPFLDKARVSTKPLLSESLSCMKTSETLLAVAGEVIDQQTNQTLFKQMADHAVHRAFVLEQLTLGLEANFGELRHVIATMETEQRHLYGELVTERFNNTQAFHFSKYDALLIALRDHFASLSSNGHVGVPSSQQLQLNILMAVAVDLRNGFYDNARVGLALAASLSPGGMALEPSYENNSMVWRLGADFNEAYIAWNMAFLAGLDAVEGVPFFFHSYNLMIPSLLCEMSTPDGRFVGRRLTSLSLHMMGINHESFPLLKQIDGGANSSSSFALLFGRKNAQTLKIPSPSRKAVKEMLFGLCGHGKICLGGLRKASGNGPLSSLNDSQYQDWVNWVLVAVMTCSAISAQAFCLDTFVDQPRRWNARMKGLYKLAKGSFSLFAVFSLIEAQNKSGLAILSTTLCLWSWSFPEEISAISLAIREERFAWWHRLLLVLNVAANVAHHLAASLVIALVTTGVLQPGRHLSEPVMWLVLQHLALLLLYYKATYACILLIILEGLYEWSTLSYLEFVHHDHVAGAVGGIMMLLSHWLYILCGVAMLYVASSPSMDEYRRSLTPKQPRNVVSNDHNDDGKSTQTLIQATSTRDEDDEEAASPISSSSSSSSGNLEVEVCDAPREISIPFGVDVPSPAGASRTSLPPISSTNKVG